MLTFLHAADIHLDSPLRGLSHYEGAPPIEEIRGATRQALDNLVNFALEEKVNFVLVAGDLYDGDWQDFNTGLYFANQMCNLGEAGIRVKYPFQALSQFVSNPRHCVIMRKHCKKYIAHYCAMSERLS